MRLVYLPFLFSFLILHFASSQSLPHILSEHEKQILKTYTPPVSVYGKRTPPLSPVRTMAEWEECQGIIITWVSFTSILRQIVDYAQDEGNVYIVCSDSTSVKNYLGSGGVPLTNVHFLILPFNSIWCRDYGPWAVYSGENDSLGLTDWIYNRPRPKDDTVSVGFAKELQLPLYQTTTSPDNLIATGGNFMADGHGTGFSSKLILNENPSHTEEEIDTIMKNYMGIERYIKLNTLPYDQIHHIDMHIKLLDEETLLVGQYPDGTADGPGIEANLNYILNNFKNCYGKNYRVVRIPMPPQGGGYPPSHDYRTYTNSLIINKTVIVPTYEYQYDTTALRIYKNAMPGYRVVGIDCNQIIPSLGAVHCITKEIGVAEPIFISHARLENTSDTSQNYEVKAYIKTKSGVAQSFVFWRTDTTMAFDSLEMNVVTGDTFSVSIPKQSFSTTVQYYITAHSNSGRRVTKPFVAPLGTYQFTIEPPAFVTENSARPKQIALYQNFPNPFNPVTAIGFSLLAISNVTLNVYDLRGMEVATLLRDKKMEAGEHQIEFNAGNLSSGIYLYRLQAGRFSETKKLVVIK